MARAQVREAELAVQAARSRLAQAKVGQQRAGADLRTAQTGPEQVAATRARAAVGRRPASKQAQAAVGRAELDLERTTVKASDGRHRQPQVGRARAGRSSRASR